MGGVSPHGTPPPSGNCQRSRAAPFVTQPLHPSRLEAPTLSDCLGSAVSCLPLECSRLLSAPVMSPCGDKCGGFRVRSPVLWQSSQNAARVFLPLCVAGRRDLLLGTAVWCWTVRVPRPGHKKGPGVLLAPSVPPCPPSLESLTVGDPLPCC